MSILIKMNPSESDNFADIVMTISAVAYENNKDAIESLKKGDHLIFDASFAAMGNEFKLHHLRL